MKACIQAFILDLTDVKQMEFIIINETRNPLYNK